MSVAVVVDDVVCLLGHCPVEEAVLVPGALLTHHLQRGLVVSVNIHLTCDLT